ncbi:X-ray repair cross-complementing protein 5 [Chiloscyllium plagiosum]|uniref:X-ray repair cross-complementing protein 5 n=1 Tax=Chiloscyllium plagiosum TaxID=36176 RepID=UPI001CB81D8B|nr:X-ray repair cross-complementing protein 5 [Chiloscyllium plagiosum]
MMARANKSAVVVCWDVGCTTNNMALDEDSAFEQAKKVVLMFVQRQVFAESKDETALVLFGTDRTFNPLATSDQYQNIVVQRNLMIPDFDFLEDIQNGIKTSHHQADFLDALIVCMDLLQKQTMGKKYDKLHIAVFTDLNSPFSSDQFDAIISSMKKFGITLQFFLPFTNTTRESVERLSIFKKIERKPMTWPCQLTIGSGITINIVGYKAMTEEKVKKSWMSVDAKTLRKEDVRRETVYCLNDDNETEVSKEDTIQGFRYGSDIIPFSQVDQEQMKYKTDGKCFSVLGFTKSAQVLQHYYVGRQVLQVFAAKDDEHAAVALSALIHALQELDMMAIVRYIYDRRSNPQVGVAFPMIKDKYECLVYIQLPFMEDLRQFTFISLKNSKRGTASEEQLSAVDALIDSMSLVVDDGEEIEDLFKVSKIPNPHFQRLFQCLHFKAFQPDKPLPPIDPHLKTMLDRPQELNASYIPSMEQLKKLFTLQDSGKKKEQKIAQQIFKDNDTEELASKRGRTDEDFNIVTLAEGNVTAVGSLTPAKDFQTLVRQKNSNFREVTNQLMERVYQFLEVKNREYYMKSMDCIKICREEAGKAGESKFFNMLLKTLKANVEAKGLQDFWELIVQDSITLITKDEAADSTVNNDEAKQFLAAEEKPMETSAVPEDDGDVDDLHPHLLRTTICPPNFISSTNFTRMPQSLHPDH